MLPGWLWSGLIWLVVYLLVALTVARLLRGRASKRLAKTVGGLTYALCFGVTALLSRALGLMTKAGCDQMLVVSTIVAVVLGAATWVGTASD